MEGVLNALRGTVWPKASAIGAFRSRLSLLDPHKLHHGKTNSIPIQNVARFGAHVQSPDRLVEPHAGLVDGTDRTFI